MVPKPIRPRLAVARFPFPRAPFSRASRRPLSAPIVRPLHRSAWLHGVPEKAVRSVCYSAPPIRSVTRLTSIAVPSPSSLSVSLFPLTFVYVLAAKSQPLYSHAHARRRSWIKHRPMITTRRNSKSRLSVSANCDKATLWLP